VYRKYRLSIFLLIQVLALQVIWFFPGFVEQFYSNGVYISVSEVLRVAFGKIPVSVGDLIYLLLICLGIRWFWLRRGTWKKRWKSNLLKIVNAFAIVYFFFHLLWGMNYYRVKLFDKMKIEREYTNKDLLEFTQKLIAKTNEIHSKIVKDKNQKVIFPYSQESVFEMNVDGYRNLSRQYPYLEYEEPSVKKSLLSMPLTYMGFAGYLNPFTNEAQVNDKIPMYNFPTTTAHEMAHQLGYASESEANFIGYLASIRNKDAYFQYSGYSYALKYCLHNWKIRDEKILKQLLPTIHPGILKNYDDAEKFWSQYDTFIEKGFEVFYDNFLKFNQQKDGLESYSKFVDLMVNYYKQQSF